MWEENLRMMEQAPEDFRPRADPEDVRKIERLVAFVDAALGDSKKSETHPLADLIRNWVDWNFKGLAEISDNLLLAARCSGYERIIRDLGNPSPTKWEATVKELQVLGDLARSGFEVRIVPEGTKRSHDLTVTVEDTPVHIEVTNIGMSLAESRSRQEIDWRNWNIQDFKGASVTLGIHKPLSRPHRQEVKEKILELIERAREGDTGFRESFTEEGVFSVTVEKGGKPKSGTMNISGPDIDRNELGRLYYTIKEKASQLPTNEPGILIVFDSRLLTARFKSSDYSGVVENIEEAVFDFPHLVGLLLIIEFQDPTAADLFAAEGHWFAWRQKSHGWAVSDRIFIQNKYSATVPDVRILAAFGLPEGPA